MDRVPIWKVDIENRAVLGIRNSYYGLAQTAAAAGKKALALEVAVAKSDDEKPRPRLAVHSIQNIGTRDF